MNDHVRLGAIISQDANPSLGRADCHVRPVRSDKDKKHIVNQWPPRRHRVGKHTEATNVSDANAGTYCGLTPIPITLYPHGSIVIRLKSSISFVYRIPFVLFQFLLFAPTLFVKGLVALIAGPSIVHVQPSNMYNPFTTEAWTEYAVGMVIIFSRIAARCFQVGLNWEGDDYFTILCAVFFTAELVMLELIGRYGSITGMSNEIALELTPEQTQRIVVGSKCLLAGWILYTTLIWCLKACMLFFYRRLTLNLQQRNLVKITGAVCIVAYIATIVAFLTHCHPVYRLWQVYPYPGDDCALNISKYLALVVTNITTDLMILYIPLPLLWSVRLPLRRKLLYFFWLCTGIFIMTATLLRCILCLQDVSQINVGTIWSIRETFVGIIAVNAPILKPFFTRAKRAVSSVKQSQSSSGNGLPDSLRLSHVERKGKKRSVHEITNMDTTMNESEEHIISPARRAYSNTNSREERDDV